MEGPTESAAPPGDAGGAIASPRRRVSLRAACGMAMKDAVATLFFIVVITVVPLSVTAAGTLAAVAAAKTVSRLRGGGGAGLSAWEIEAIPAWVYAAAGEGWRDEECAVCLAEYEEGEELRRLDCGHSYHGDCIGQWLRHRAACPKCVSKVTVEVRRRGIRRLCGDFPAVLRRWVGR